MSGRGADELRIASILRSRGVGPAGEPPQPDAVTAAAAAVQSQSLGVQPQPSASDAPGDGWWDELYADESTAADADVQPDATAAEESSATRPGWMRIPPWWSGRHVDTAPPTAASDEDADEDEDDPEPDGKDGEDDEDDEDDVEDEEEPDGSDTAAPRRTAAPRGRRLQPRSRRAPGRRPTASAPRALVDTPAAPRRSLLDAAASVEPRIRWLILHASAAAAGYRIGWVDYSTRTAAWIAANGWLNASTVFWCAIAVGCEVLRLRAHRTRLLIRWVAAVPIASIVTGTLLYGTGWTHLDLGVSL